MNARFYFDYVDPLSFLLDRELRAAEAEAGAGGGAIDIERIGVEIRPPPEPLTDPADPFWADRWRRAMVHSGTLGLELHRPTIVPWSRKAHELLLHARELGEADAVHEALFAGFFQEGRDIGRVDVLVDIAVEHGLDASAAKAVLDVDRHTEEVEAIRKRVLTAGIGSIPTLETGGHELQGFHNREDIRTFLLRAP